MTKEEWLTQARSYEDALKSLVGEYHPSVGYRRHTLPITAPAAEDACISVREKISQAEPQDPVQRLTVALATGDVSEIYSVLGQAWFGVPESTSCWNIRGFKEAVDLMDDPPEPPEPNDD